MCVSVVLDFRVFNLLPILFIYVKENMEWLIIFFKRCSNSYIQPNVSFCICTNEILKNIYSMIVGLFIVRLRETW